MKSYLIWSAEDFACDDDFLKWVKYPDQYPHLDTFWRNWLMENPHKKEVIEEAKSLVLAVMSEDQQLPEDALQQAVWERIQETTRASVTRQSSGWQFWYSKAAIILLAGFLGWFSFDFAPEEAIALIAGSDPAYITHVNNAEVEKTIILSDGTSIILQPHSVLEYPVAFREEGREVHLTGQAFFDVARDPNRPFLVKAGEIVTRVLGTSFTVRNVEGEDVLVQVKTGKVSVFMASDKVVTTDPIEKIVDGVVLMPNQQVLYERLEMKMTKSLVEDPVVLKPVEKLEFEFVDAPIKDVFLALEEAYGVDIVFDEEALSSCFLNASLTDIALYDKLKLICRGINTTYEIIDSHIIIYGKGCNDNSTHPKSN